VDLETLEILVKIGIRYTILSPYQAKRTRKLKGRAWEGRQWRKNRPVYSS
jgi:hypothetical protein